MLDHQVNCYSNGDVTSARLTITIVIEIMIIIIRVVLVARRMPMPYTLHVWFPHELAAEVLCG